MIHNQNARKVACINFTKEHFMNLKSRYGLLLVCLIISHSSKAQDYQLATQPLFRSVFSSGISNYLQVTYNDPLYSHNNSIFFHTIELLQHGNKTEKNKTYFKSVLRLITNKLKSAPYINAYAFFEMLAQMPTVLEAPFAINKERGFGSLKDIIYELQYQQFKTNFPLFKSSPDTFLEALSAEIEDASELRTLMLIFLETSMSKLVWSPEDNLETWICTKNIADQLALMASKSIIANLDDLNSLYITLLERYCFFLDLAGTTMDVATFDKIKADIAANRINFLELEEQEELIETKMQRFTRCLAEVEAKARAYEQGMLV